MAEAISQALRREIRARAGGRCEYCLMLEIFLMAGCEVDHIVSRKHRGISKLSNLAMSCTRLLRVAGRFASPIHFKYSR